MVCLTLSFLIHTADSFCRAMFDRCFLLSISSLSPRREPTFLTFLHSLLSFVTMVYSVLLVFTVSLASARPFSIALTSAKQDGETKSTSSA